VLPVQRLRWLDHRGDYRAMQALFVSVTSCCIRLLTACDSRPYDRSMTTDQAIEFFGGQSELARLLEIRQPSVATWDKYPPPLRQLQMEALSDGWLKAEPDCDKYRVPA
jgi:hypothetical protein